MSLVVAACYFVVAHQIDSVHFDLDHFGLVAVHFGLDYFVLHRCFALLADPHSVLDLDLEMMVDF